MPSQGRWDDRDESATGGDRARSRARYPVRRARAQAAGSRSAGSSVLGEVLRHAVASHLPVVVVTTDALAEEARRTSLRATWWSCRQRRRAPMAAALPHGASATRSPPASRARPDASGWLILPADMPLVQRVDAGRVARHLDHHAVVYAQYQGRRGHPVGFSPELYSELVSLQGDEGARRLVARYPAHAVEVDDPGVLLDIDTEADLLEARAAHASRGAPRARLRTAEPLPSPARSSACRARQRHQALDLAVANAAARAGRAPSPAGSRACGRSGRWHRAGSRPSRRRAARRCSWAAPIERERQAPARVPSGVRQGSQRASYTPVGISRSHSCSSSASARSRAMRYTTPRHDPPRTSANTSPGRSGVPRLTRERICSAR